MKLRAALMLPLAALTLTACASTSRGRTVELPGGVAPEQQRNQPNMFERLLGQDDRPNAGPCPLMGVLYDNSRLVQFAQPNNERYANIAFTGEMQGIRGLCRYVDDDPIEMSVEVNMAFGRGPASTSDRQTYRYWVAVVRQGFAPIAKEYFDVEVRFRDGEPVVTQTEEIRNIVIPRASADTSGANFEVLVGWELTPEQLAFNRAGKRFRIDSAENAG